MFGLFVVVGKFSLAYLLMAVTIIGFIVCALLLPLFHGFDDRQVNKNDDSRSINAHDDCNDDSKRESINDGVINYEEDTSEFIVDENDDVEHRHMVVDFDPYETECNENVNESEAPEKLGKLGNDAEDLSESMEEQEVVEPIDTLIATLEKQRRAAPKGDDSMFISQGKYQRTEINPSNLNVVSEKYQRTGVLARNSNLGKYHWDETKIQNIGKNTDKILKHDTKSPVFSMTRLNRQKSEPRESMPSGSSDSYGRRAATPTPTPTYSPLLSRYAKLDRMETSVSISDRQRFEPSIRTFNEKPGNQQIKGSLEKEKRVGTDISSISSTLVKYHRAKPDERIFTENTGRYSRMRAATPTYIPMVERCSSFVSPTSGRHCMAEPNVVILTEKQEKRQRNEFNFFATAKQERLQMSKPSYPASGEASEKVETGVNVKTYTNEVSDNQISDLDVSAFRKPGNNGQINNKKLKTPQEMKQDEKINSDFNDDTKRHQNDDNNHAINSESEENQRAVELSYPPLIPLQQEEELGDEPNTLTSSTSSQITESKMQPLAEKLSKKYRHEPEGAEKRPYAMENISFTKDDQDTLTLVFQSVRPEGEADLRTFLASTTTGKISCNARLTVEGTGHYMQNWTPPEITMELPTIEVNPGDSAMLDLMVKGFPRPQLTWFKNGQKVAAGGRFHVLCEDEEAAFLIKRVKEEDAGKYTVEVRNNLGTATSVGCIYVKASPKFKKKMLDMTCIVDETIQMTAEVEGYSPPHVTWFKDGHLLSESNRLSFIKECEENHTMVINHACPEDSGYYCVVATNQFGDFFDFWSVNVLDPQTHTVQEESTKTGVLSRM